MGSVTGSEVPCSGAFCPSPLQAGSTSSHSNRTPKGEASGSAEVRVNPRWGQGRELWAHPPSEPRRPERHRGSSSTGLGGVVVPTNQRRETLGESMHAHTCTQAHARSPRTWMFTAASFTIAGKETRARCSPIGGQVRDGGAATHRDRAAMQSQSLSLRTQPGQRSQAMPHAVCFWYSKPRERS